ncbi:Zinc finger protein 226 [Plakobranchus ocellatus]|uniref:Zinc finger protein 226 n=1 Tax=Plakobranchus ocellatus TaxID=259542 RepID=A0AAV4E0V7_9GAST|nr:Zinc finger protein 226 [Plakobranchus ocellatus]
MNEALKTSEDCPKSLNSCLEKLEKVAILFVELLEQATLYRCLVQSLQAVRRVRDLLNGNVSLWSSPKSIYHDQGTQTFDESSWNICTHSRTRTVDDKKVRTRRRKLQNRIYEEIQNKRKGKLGESVKSSKQTENQMISSPHPRLNDETCRAINNEQTVVEIKAINEFKKINQGGLVTKKNSRQKLMRKPILFQKSNKPLTDPGGAKLSLTKRFQNGSKVVPGGCKKSMSQSFHSCLKQRDRLQLYSCKFCKNKFICQQNLKDHMSQQHKYFDYGPNFLNKCQLQFQAQTAHEAQQTYVCDFCFKTFKSQSVLKGHYMEWHGLTGKTNTKVLFSCDLCGMSCKDAAELCQHIALHLNDGSDVTLAQATRGQKKLVLCQICGKSLSTYPALVAHQKLHQTGSKFHCDFCKEIFTNILELKNHREKHDNEERPYKCPQCDKGFKTRTTLRTHKMLHTGEQPYACDVCGKRFIQTSGLNAHKLRHTAQEENIYNKTNVDETAENNPLCCKICGRLYKTELRLQAHLKAHNQTSDLQCQLCSKMFTTTREAAIHKHTHFKGKLCCKMCGKISESRSEHYFHCKSHDPVERSYLCSKCGRSFITLADLETHQKRHEVQAKERKYHDPFICTVCGKAYVGRNSLTIHMKVHAGVFDLPCDLCPKKFKTWAELRHHRRVHTNEKPYVCNVCSRTFSRHSTLANHRRSHNERPYICIVCGAAFKLMNTMKKHGKIHKKDKPRKISQDTTSKACQQQGFSLEVTEGNHKTDINPNLQETNFPIPPPPPYPSDAVGDAPPSETRPNSQPAQPSCSPLVQSSVEPESLLDLAQPQLSSQLSEQTLQLLGLSSTRLPQSQVNLSNVLNSKASWMTSLPLPGHTLNRRHLPLPLTSSLTEPQMLTAVTQPAQQIQNIYQPKTENLLGATKSQTINQFQSTKQAHLLGLQGELRMTSPLQSTSQSSSEQVIGSIDQPLFKLQRQMANHSSASIIRTPALPQQTQTFFTPTDLVLRPVDFGSNDNPSGQLQIPVSGVEDLSDYLHIIQPTSSPLAINPPTTHIGQTMVLFSTGQFGQSQEFLSLSNTSDPFPTHLVHGLQEDDEDRAEGEEIEADNHEEGRESTPNLLDLPNTTSYTYYYY